MAYHGDGTLLSLTGSGELILQGAANPLLHANIPGRAGAKSLCPGSGSVSVAQEQGFKAPISTRPGWSRGPESETIGGHPWKYQGPNPGFSLLDHFISRSSHLWLAQKVRRPVKATGHHHLYP